MISFKSFTEARAHDLNPKYRGKSTGELSKMAKDNRTYSPAQRKEIEAEIKMRSQVREEAEDLDELSKKTLGSYVKKASRDISDRDRKAGFKIGRDGPKPGLNKANIKNSKRQISLDKAVNKMSEDLQLDELSDKLLYRYKVGAAPSHKKLADKQRKHYNAVDRQFKNRLKGKTTKINSPDLTPREKARKLSRTKGMQLAHDKSPKIRKAKVIATEETSTAWQTRQGKWANSHKGGFESKEDAENHYAKAIKKTVPLSKLKPATEETQLDELSNKTMRSYLDKAVVDHGKRFSAPAKPHMLTKTGRHKKSYLNSPEYKKGNKKLQTRRASIQKAALKVTGRKHFSDMDGKPTNASDWHKGKKYTKEDAPGMATGAVPGAGDDNTLHTRRMKKARSFKAIWRRHAIPKLKKD